MVTVGGFGSIGSIHPAITERMVDGYNSYYGQWEPGVVSSLPGGSLLMILATASKQPNSDCRMANATWNGAGGVGVQLDTSGTVSRAGIACTQRWTRW